MSLTHQPLPLRLLGLLILALITADAWTPSLHQLIADDRVFSVTLHTVMESFAILVSFLVFAISWNTYSHERAGNIVIIACGFLCVGVIDFAHMLSYKGMPDFVTESSPQKAITFWLSARYIAAATLLVVALRGWQAFSSPRTRFVLLAASLGTGGLIYYLGLMHPSLWPLMFVEGHGLTSLKVFLEYLLVALLIIPAILFYRGIGQKTGIDAGHLLTATLISILSELCFTLYPNVNDIYSLLGHSYKIIAYYYIYRAIFVTSVQAPYARLSAEIEERLSAERAIEYLAYHDTLTDLPNRTLVQTRLEHAITVARNNRHQCAIAFVDIDNFKSINDSLGHAAGDQLLKTMAERLSQCINTNDTLARYGGDEFILIISHLEDAEALLPSIEKVLTLVQEPCDLNGEEVTVTASVGLVLFPDDGETFDILLQKADTAMYRAKELGGNTYQYFETAMNTAATEYLSIRNGIKKGLDRNEFELYYQPQLDIDSNRVVGVEALVRWNHPEWGIVSPARFIPIAEDSGLILPLSNWILDEACQQAMAWQAAGLPPLRMAVNLSAIQFQRDNLVERVTSSLNKSGLSPKLLELELTESIMMLDSELTLATVHQLKALGIRFAVDDFGTGYSSLSYLKQFAVNVLKIDQSFVRNVASNDNDLAIVNAVIQMAHSLGLDVIAEGVETPAALEVLDRYGCNEAQGYLFGKPMTAHAFLTYMRNGQTRAIID